MKKRKILARIGAMIAVALIVASLAIPAFADYNTSILDDAQVSALTDNFLRLYGSELGNAGSLLINRGLSPSEQRDFYSYSLFTGGQILKGVDEIYTPVLNIQVTANGEYDYIVYGEMTVAVVYGDYTDYHSRIYENDICSFWVFCDEDGNYTAELRLDVESGNDRIVYSTATPNQLNTLQLMYYVIDGVMYSSTDYASPWVSLLASDYNIDIFALSRSLLFGEKPQNILNPNMFAQTLIESDLISDSYERGYEDGYGFGYRVGYGEGQASTDTYRQGYNDAVSDIDSGQFGKNLIGSIFRAPFDAMREFTLVEWTTEGGTDITISLATIVSAGIGVALFIWFLKMFAGG